LLFGPAMSSPPSRAERERPPTIAVAPATPLDAGEWIGPFAHDLRNAIGFACSSLRLAWTAVDDPELAELIGAGSEAARRGLIWLRSLREIVAVGIGAVPPLPALAALGRQPADVLDSLVECVRDEIRGDGVRITVKPLWPGDGAVVSAELLGLLRAVLVSLAELNLRPLDVAVRLRAGRELALGLRAVGGGEEGAQRMAAALATPFPRLSAEGGSLAELGWELVRVYSAVLHACGRVRLRAGGADILFVIGAARQE
jgi:hypothetical protein